MKRRNLFLVVSTGLLASLLSGCASYLARKDLENVAKGWCQTIRASQVIPVYPLTEDLVVGDVFLVRTTISQQASDYKSKGFLPLDDALVRLKYTNFSGIYFSGYWTDEFGSTPHPAPVFTNNGSYTNVLTAAPIARAAFPSYSFKAKSGFGVNLAFPIEGVPVALSYLNSQQVDGSVTISDARTYAGDPGELYSLLKAWAGDPTNQQLLTNTALDALPTRVFLRVVSRVYYARAIDLALHRSGSQGGGAKAGVVNDVSLMLTNGSVAENYTNLLGLLSTMAASTASSAQAGGAIKFVSASDSTVGLSQSFDRLLAVGYLGFDVPLSTNGDIGTPIPTFQLLNRRISSPRSPSFAPATAAPLPPGLQKRKEALAKALAGIDDPKVSKVMAALGLPSDLRIALQNQIEEAWTESAIRKLETCVQNRSTLGDEYMALKLETLNTNDTLPNLQATIAGIEALGYELLAFARGVVSGAQSNTATFRNRAPGGPPGPLMLVEVDGTQTLLAMQAAANEGEATGKELISYAAVLVRGSETNVAVYRG